ncbi:2OG-Fe(II)oxygenase family Oxidoreductase [Colletotrichum salicis]|uniref:2OG-Fe(II)oxygenase family Oxidoreductase n=1 Tax=Colletotrichum salicis TaxID=1209931 RepID=A0A135TVI6_9PEZI|nr:2OG-Fe(II)oxygenase family Oxidoreductase [Colletotrichum salicis]
MISYVIALVAFLVFFSDPLVNFFSSSDGRSTSSRSRVARTLRPQMNESLLAIEHANATALSCPPDDYSVRIFSKEPLVLYIEGFLSVEERKHLLKISATNPPFNSHLTYLNLNLISLTQSPSNPIFEPSTITHNGANTHRDTSIRSSDVALLPRDDTVRCIEARARALQGWREDLWIERLRTQRYVEGGHYSYHFDWTANRGGWGRPLLK